LEVCGFVGFRASVVCVFFELILVDLHVFVGFVFLGFKVLVGFLSVTWRVRWVVYMWWVLFSFTCLCVDLRLVCLLL